MVCHSHLFKKCPQFAVIHTVQEFSVVNEAEVDVLWNSLAFSTIQNMLAICSLVPLPFLNLDYTVHLEVLSSHPAEAQLEGY